MKLRVEAYGVGTGFCLAAEVDGYYAALTMPWDGLVRETAVGLQVLWLRLADDAAEAAGATLDADEVGRLVHNAMPNVLATQAYQRRAAEWRRAR